MKKTILILSFILSLSLSLNAKENPKNEEIEKALKECSKIAGKDSGGRPNMQKFDECMSEKGFEKPKGKHPAMNGSHPPKPMDSNN